VLAALCCIYRTWVNEPKKAAAQVELLTRDADAPEEASGAAELGTCCIAFKGAYIQRLGQPNAGGAAALLLRACLLCSAMRYFQVPNTAVSICCRHASFWIMLRAQYGVLKFVLVCPSAASVGDVVEPPPQSKLVTQTLAAAAAAANGSACKAANGIAGLKLAAARGAAAAAVRPVAVAGKAAV
jgi:hypothetical protein